MATDGPDGSMLDALKQQPREQQNGHKTATPLPEPPPTLITVTRGYAYACPIVIADPTGNNEPPITCGYYHATPHNPIGPEGEQAWYFDWCPGCQTSLVVTAVTVEQHQHDHQWQWAIRQAGPEEQRQHIYGNNTR